MRGRRRPEPAASIRGRHRLAEFQPHIRQLGEIVLDGKKDIKFHRTCETSEGARKWGDKYGYVLRDDEDINGDQIDDIVLYTRTGEPVVINGYELVKSESKIREKYRTDVGGNDELRARIGGFTEYKKRFYQTPNAERFVEDLDTDTYAVPKRAQPRARIPVYNQFCKVVVPRIQSVINQLTPPDKMSIKSTISAIAVAAMMYVDYVLEPLWNDAENEPAKTSICAKTDDPNERMKLFTKYMGTTPDAINRQFNRLTEQLNQSITPQGIAALLDMLGYDMHTRNEAPNDIQAKTAEGRLAILQIKNRTTEQIESIKQEHITTTFGDGE